MKRIVLRIILILVTIHLTESIQLITDSSLEDALEKNSAKVIKINSEETEFVSKNGVHQRNRDTALEPVQETNLQNINLRQRRQMPETRIDYARTIAMYFLAQRTMIMGWNWYKRRGGSAGALFRPITRPMGAVWSRMMSGFGYVFYRMLRMLFNNNPTALSMINFMNDFGAISVFRMASRVM